MLHFGPRRSLHLTVCRHCALQLFPRYRISSVLNVSRKCSRAGLVTGKLLISQFIRSRKPFRRSDGRYIVFMAINGDFTPVTMLP